MQKRLSIFLITVALIAGMVGCVPAQYSLTISSTEGGEVIIPGEGTLTYDEVTVVNLVAEAEEGYRFVEWTGDVDDIANVEDATTTITMDDNYSITAEFAVKQYDLIISSTVGGEVTAPGEGAFAYDAGAVVDLVAEPEEGYKFVNWTGNVSTIFDVNATVTTITIHTDCALIASFEEDEVVTFIDLNLEAAVRQAIAKPESPIYTRDMEQLTQLDADHSGIYDLTGLEYATRLTRLSLWNNQISDISSLANLTSLTNLNLGYNQISDISPLANLTNLMYLDFEDNQISDISPVANLTSLTDLDIDSNRFSDISPLTNLTSLISLDIAHNQIRDISPLANLPNLTRLEVEDIGITDISPLANLPNLTCLLVDDNEITDISPLADLTGLTGIGLSGHSIADISHVVDLSELTWLGISNSQIRNVSPLANLTNLTTLWLQDNRISDISPLANLTNLTSLRVDGNVITDISPVANLTNLTMLWLQDNRISDISPLVDNEGLSEGDEVYLWGNPMSSDSINIYIPQLEARGVSVSY